MIVVGYTVLDPENNERTNTIYGEYEATSDGQQAFNEMIDTHSTTDNVIIFFWGSRTSPDEYEIVAYRDNEV